MTCRLLPDGLRHYMWLEHGPCIPTWIPAFGNNTRPSFQGTAQKSLLRGEGWMILEFALNKSGWPPSYICANLDTPFWVLPPYKLNNSIDIYCILSIVETVFLYLCIRALVYWIFCSEFLPKNGCHLFRFWHNLGTPSLQAFAISSIPSANNEF